MIVGVDYGLGDKMAVWIRPNYMLCGTVQYAMLNAHIDFQNRDRRRIKREVNKAAKKARRAARR